MRRDLSTLRRWATAVEHDAQNALDGAWSVAVDDSYVLTVRRDDVREQVLLADTVDEDSWPPAAWVPEHRRSTLELEAAEAVADEFLEVLRLWDLSWVSCSEHDRPVSHCSAEWICASSPVHAIALFGDLQPLRTARRPTLTVAAPRAAGLPWRTSSETTTPRVRQVDGLAAQRCRTSPTASRGPPAAGASGAGCAALVRDSPATRR